MSATGDANHGFQIDPQTVDSMQVDGEVVVLSLVNHAYFGLNDTATAVWELVKAHPGISSTAIAMNLAARYDHTSDTIFGDVTRLLEALSAQQLVSAGSTSPVTPAAATRSSQPYVAPRLETYGALDTLILSGE